MSRRSSAVYLTALMESVSVPDGTLTVIRSPFFLPTRARPTGEPLKMGPSDHLLELVDPAVQETDLFLGLLVLGVVLDITRLERLLQALAGLGTPLQRDFKIALELLEPLGREQYRFSEVHLAAF